MNARGTSLAGFAGRRLWLCLLLAVAVGALATAGASAASRSPAPAVTRSTPVARGAGYLALGDSVTFGFQEVNVTPAPNYFNAASFHGYPQQLGTALHLKVTNLSCPGETAASLINFRALSNGCENSYRKNFPLHVRYKGSQLAYAVSFLRTHPGVRLVSLMIGANDLFLCEEHSPDGCANPAEQQAVLARIGRNVKTILSAIRGRARYRGQLAIVNYYSLNYASPLVNGESNELNRAQDAAARPFHVVVANGYAEFRTASIKFGNQPCLAGLITQLDGQVGKCGVHPTYAGSALLAQALEKVVRF